MAKNLSVSICRNILSSGNTNLKSANTAFGNIVFKSLHTNERPVKEVQIPVKWGHVAGKLWGSENERPILALHGWQDNCGTWDPLIPMLSTKQPVLAIDFPGHGLSSWFPPGMHYYTWELSRLILQLKDHFKWDKVSLMCHSLGAVAGLRFASVFPDDVDFYIAVDGLVHDGIDKSANKYPSMLRKIEIAQSHVCADPPTYTLEEMAQMWHLGTNKSLDLERVQYLLKNGVKPSKRDPNKYCFSRDPRVKNIMFTPEDKMFVEGLVKRLQCPTLYIKATDSTYSTDDLSMKLRDIIRTNNNKFESQTLTGTHYVHLNNPEKVTPLITQFLQKHNLTK